MTLPGLIGPKELYPTMASFASFLVTESLPEIEKRTTMAIQTSHGDLSDKIGTLESKVRSITIGAPVLQEHDTQHTEHFNGL